MIQYHVRSRYLVDLYNEIKAGKLILSPFFQRKLVWRLTHKEDFIKTILSGYPFPEIFLARGSIDVDSMLSTSCVVDGQQRMNSIKEFIENGFKVDGRFYNEMDLLQKESFLKYEIAIIELDMRNDDARIIDIFKRLNRTYYALSNIEKLATEFASSDFMLTAKLLCGEFAPDGDEPVNIRPSLLEQDPNITPEFAAWANQQNLGHFQAYLLETPIFSKYEISRNVQLMFTLNVMATSLIGYYNRNEGATRLVEDHAQQFPQRDHVVTKLNNTAAFIHKCRFKTSSEWYTKSNSFSLFMLLAENETELRSLDPKIVKDRLDEFAATMPADYSLAGKEAVNNRKERLLRRKYLRTVLFPDTPDPLLDDSGGDILTT